MNGRPFKCTCENDGYIDYLMKRMDKRPKLLAPTVLAPRKPDVRRLGERMPKTWTPPYGSRRDFFKKMAIGAAALLAWQGGLGDSVKRASAGHGMGQPTRCGGWEGDPTWDLTFDLGTPWFMSCDDWGARPPSQPITVLYHAPTYVVVHHTATANSTDYSQEHAISLARAIQNYHMDNNGWIDTGQHFTHTRGTYLLEGRHRSIEIELLACYDSHVLGAHVANYNSVTLGIENEGTYVTVDPPIELVQSLINVVITCCFYNSVHSWNVKGHRDFNATQCPGDRLYAWLPTIRDWVAYYLEGGRRPR